MFSDSCGDFGYFWASSNESIDFDYPKEFDDPQIFEGLKVISNESMDLNDPNKFDDPHVFDDSKGILIGSLDFDNPKVYSLFDF